MVTIKTRYGYSDKMLAKETAMIELTEEQRESIDKGRAVRIHKNGREYVLLHPDVYDRLADGGYDDRPWDAKEMDLLREESVDLLDRYGKDV
jgi:hypothetical protein